MTAKYPSFILRLINVKILGDLLSDFTHMNEYIDNRYSYAIFLCLYDIYYAHYLKLSLQMFYLSRFLGR